MRLKNGKMQDIYEINVRPFQDLDDNRLKNGRTISTTIALLRYCCRNILHKIVGKSTLF